MITLDEDSGIVAYINVVCTKDTPLEEHDKLVQKFVEKLNAEEIKIFKPYRSKETGRWVLGFR